MYVDVDGGAYVQFNRLFVYFGAGEKHVPEERRCWGTSTRIMCHCGRVQLVFLEVEK